MSSNSSPDQPSALQILTDIGKILINSHDANETLVQTATTIAKRMQMDACSIYIFDKQTEYLVLRSTFGLNPQVVGKVQMPISEGLTGLVFQRRETVQASDMQFHPRFKHFPETQEEQYCSFLGVPLIELNQAFGVLVVHTIECRTFSQEEEHLLITISSQISGFISKALFIENLHQKTKVAETTDVHLHNTQYRGITIAGGIAIGNAVLMETDILEEPTRETTLSISEEEQKFRQACDSAIKDILELANQVGEQLGEEEANIFHAHLLFLEDRSFLEKIIGLIHEGNSAVWSIYQSIQQYLKVFANMNDPYLKERGADVQNVGSRLLFHLGHGQYSPLQKEGILVVKRLLPSDVASMDTNKITGILTSQGGIVSHAAILARSLSIPSICLSEEELEKIKENDLVAIDAQHGFIVINPTQQVLQEFQRLLVEQTQFLQYLERFQELPCQTKNQVRITTLANVGLPNDLQTIQQYHAEGIGLYRTEMFFLLRDQYPTIEEQATAYQIVVESVPPDHPIYFRTLDLGSDKLAPYMKGPKEENPFLGLRAIRRYQKHPQHLKEQITAILLASVNRKHLHLSFPMISHLEELQFAKKIYFSCREQLEQQGYTLPQVYLGMIVEIPAVITMCEQFVTEVDFFSIGSNDLTQYLFAVDRNNPAIAHLYNPLHPAVLRVIHQLVSVAKEANIPVSICGEMASDPDGCVLLTGIGVHLLSIQAPLIPTIKERLSHFTLLETEKIAQAAMQMSSVQQVREAIASFLAERKT